VTQLLEFAVAAHGGIDRWNDFRRLTAEVSIGGEIWRLKRQPWFLDGVVSELHTHEERLTISRTARPQSMSFKPGCVTVQHDDDGMVECCYNPQSAFLAHDDDAPWNAFHVAYFSSSALWTYLTSPFLYTYPGFVTDELDPWYENGEVWRRLKVTFPDYIVSHTREQVSYIGPDGLVRRHDCIIDLLGGARSANYAHDYRDFQGIKIPTVRQVFFQDKDGQRICDTVMEQIDIGNISFR
jgi:hypothetical protein